MLDPMDINVEELKKKNRAKHSRSKYYYTDIFIILYNPSKSIFDKKRVNFGSFGPQCRPTEIRGQKIQNINTRLDSGYLRNNIIQDCE